MFISAVLQATDTMYSCPLDFWLWHLYPFGTGRAGWHYSFIKSHSISLRAALLRAVHLQTALPVIKSIYSESTILVECITFVTLQLSNNGSFFIRSHMFYRLVTYMGKCQKRCLKRFILDLLKKKSVTSIFSNFKIPMLYGLYVIR